MPRRAATTSAPTTSRKGRCESSVDRAVLAAYAAGVVDKDLDAAAIALARTLARATDQQATPDGMGRGRPGPGAAHAAGTATA
jgi:hypothetical protein